MKKYIFILFVSLVSCSSSSPIILYKDKELLTTPVSINSIKDFNWVYKGENILDSLVFKGKKAKDIKGLIAKMKEIPGLAGQKGTPRYAFVLDYNNKRDTLYFYDFNDNDNYKSRGYLVQSDIVLQDTNDELKKYLFEYYTEFITKEYYYLPNSTKEHHYSKE